MTAETAEAIGEDLPKAAFNYDCLDKQQATKLRQTAASIRKTGHDAFLKIGAQLLETKEWMKHGLFVEWVETECQIGIRTAERAMRAAKTVAKNDKLSVLAVDALVALDSSTDEIRDKVVSDIEAGRKPTADEIRERLKSKPGDTGSANGSGTSDATSASPTTAPEPTPEPPPTPEPVAVTVLDQLLALWACSDPETRTLFRQKIEESGTDFPRAEPVGEPERPALGATS